MDSSAVDVESCDVNGLTLLHVACNRGWSEVVRSLVSKGCDLNAKDSFGKTHSMLAAHWSRSSMVKYLIDCGADVQG